MLKTILFHPEKCTGCRECQKECLIARDAARIRVASWAEDDGRTRSCILQCQQCLDAKCIEACPAGALERYPLGTLVTYDPVACTRCGLCTEACDLGGIYYDPLVDIMAKCDLCGGEPHCVPACATGALELTDDSLQTAKQKESGFALLRKAAETIKTAGA